MAADNIKFRQGSLEALSRQAIANGTLWFTTNENAIYLDTNGERIRFGDYVTVANVASLPAAGHAYESALYYAKEENILARWDATTSKWVQLNAAGLSSIVVNNAPGTDAPGNVLAGATIALNDKGAKVLTFSTANVTTDVSFNALQTRVGSLETKMTAVEAKLAGIGEGQTVTGLIDAAKTEMQDKIDAVDTKAGQGIADAKAASDAAAQVQTNLNSTNTRLEAAEGKVANLEKAMGDDGSVDDKINDAVADLLGSDADEAGAETVHGALKAAAAAQSKADTADGKADANAQNIQGLTTRVGNNETNITNLQSAIETLNADDKTEGSVDYKVAQEVAKILNDNDASDIDTLEEIASWITNDTTGAASMAKDIADLKTKNQSQDTVIEGLGTQIADNKTAAETAVSDLRTELLGDAAEAYNTLGKLEDAVIAAKAQADKGVADAAAASGAAAQVQTNLNGTNTRVEAAEGNITDLQGRMTQAEADIDAVEKAQGEMDAAYKTADNQVKTDLLGDATTYTTLGKAEDAIQSMNTQIGAINTALTWEVFQ